MFSMMERLLTASHGEGRHIHERLARILLRDVAVIRLVRKKLIFRRVIDRERGLQVLVAHVLLLKCLRIEFPAVSLERRLPGGKLRACRRLRRGSHAIFLAGLTEGLVNFLEVERPRRACFGSVSDAFSFEAAGFAAMLSPAPVIGSAIFR